MSGHPSNGGKGRPVASARREEILQAALEVLAARGFKGTSIDAVAERAGLTRQGVLHYFPSKKRLFLEVLNLRERLNRENLADRRLGEDWAGDFAETVAFEQDHPTLARVHSVVLAEAVTGQEPARGYVRDRRRALQDHLTEHLAARYGDRLPSGLDTRTGATAVFAFICAGAGSGAGSSPCATARPRTPPSADGSSARRSPSSRCRPASRDWAAPSTACRCRRSPPSSSTSSPGCRSS